jgi:hypothetical protein
MLPEYYPAALATFGTDLAGREALEVLLITRRQLWCAPDLVQGETEFAQVGAPAPRTFR